MVAQNLIFQLYIYNRSKHLANNFLINVFPRLHTLILYTERAEAATETSSSGQM